MKGYHDLVKRKRNFLESCERALEYIVRLKMRVSYSLSGANLRCTGVKWDLRKDEPYSIYDRFDFDIPVGNVGDALGSLRLSVWRRLRSLSKIIEQAAEQFPSEGPVLAKVPKIIKAPKGEAFVRIESPRGEIGCYIASEGKEEPYRLKFRRPSFYNLQILPKLLKGENIANLITILGGVDIVLGEVDG